MSLAFTKFKKDCNILKVTLVQGFCPLKTEILRFPFFNFVSWFNVVNWLGIV